MEEDNPAAKMSKKRSRKRKKKPPPPSIFNSDPVNSVSMNVETFPNMTLFPGNCAMPPLFPKNTNEIFDRFNQLLDWRLPNDIGNIRQPDVGPSYADNDDRNFSLPREGRRFSPPREGRRFSPTREGRHLSPSRFGKRRIIDSYDLRNRLDQQRGKDIDDRERKRYLPEPFDRSRIGNRFDIDDRIDLGRSDVDDRRQWSRFDTDDRGGQWNSLQGRAFEDEDPQNSRIPAGERVAIDESNSQNHWDNLSEPYVRRATDNVRSNSAAEPLPFDDERVRWPNERNYNLRDCYPDNIQEFGRDVKEYWPSRHQSEMDSFQRSLFGPNDERSDSCVRNENFNKADDYHTMQTWNDRFSKEMAMQRERDYYEERFQSNDLPWDEFSRNDSLPSGSRFDRSRNSIIGSRNSLSQYGTPSNDLMVVIHKYDFAKFSFPEGDKLRDLLIDLVVNCGNAENMPEFVSSGLMHGNRGFYVICRTQETIDWLLRQSLPPINGVELKIRRNRVYETVKISAFAPRCTRSRDEIFKLIQLQNGKKGFNFSNWSMRSYQTNPKGVYIAFDISLDEANLLKELGCKLSFELKSLLFKISTITEQKTLILNV